ncbi:protein SAMBA [Rhododendron vialii]|uniref:protein SAMBA n=1 Tax=Rhododendron vialii TaxID=182163 RepID=UPI00266052BE|nr:protein SAMBA [Rhododendron vialii]
MSNSSLSSSPARSSISTTAIAGANVSSALTVDEFPFPPDLISIQDRKDEALQVLKTDLMAALNKEVKSLDEDSWMFDGPRSRINLISRPGGVFHNRADITKHHKFAPSR